MSKKIGRSGICLRETCKSCGAKTRLLILKGRIRVRKWPNHLATCASVMKEDFKEPKKVSKPVVEKVD
jgi:hypothetical protein